MNHTLRNSLLRRSSILILAAGLVSGASWGIAQSLNDAKSSVSVKVDSTPMPETTDTSLSLSPIVKRVSPSVVKVLTKERAQTMQMSGSPFDDPSFRQFFGPFLNPGYGYNNPQQQQTPSQQQPEEEGLGSGVIVSPDGYILTNNHVVSGADSVTVTLDDGRQFDAKVIGTDDKTDVAVIKVDAKDLPAITFADSDKIEVGDRVVAIGNPFGLGQTVTTGIVSGTSRDIDLGIDYADFIQTDAAINPGNSGGALLDMKGRLIGINTAILSGSGGFQGVGFAIPSDLARSVMNSLVRDGKVVRGYLGVTIRDLTPDLAEQFKAKDESGALVVDVETGSPAAKAGLESGDVILNFKGSDVTNSQRLRFAVAETSPGTEAKLTVLRNGNDKDLTVKVGELDGNATVASNDNNSSQPDYRDNGVLNGVGVTDLTSQLRSEFNIPARIQGALVTEVDPNSAAAAVGLAVGDVIMGINQEPVQNANDAIKLTETSKTGKTLVKVYGRSGINFIVVDESKAQMK